MVKIIDAVVGFNYVWMQQKCGGQSNNITGNNFAYHNINYDAIFVSFLLSYS